MMKLFATMLVIVAGVVAALIALVVILTLPVWWAWNAFAPPTLGLPTVDFWGALALTILLNIVGGAGRSGGSK